MRVISAAVTPSTSPFTASPCPCVSLCPSPSLSLVSLMSVSLHQAVSLHFHKDVSSRHCVHPFYWGPESPGPQNGGCYISHVEHLDLQIPSGWGNGRFGFGRLVTVYVDAQLDAYLWAAHLKWDEVPDRGKRNNQKQTEQKAKPEGLCHSSLSVSPGLLHH